MLDRFEDRTLEIATVVVVVLIALLILYYVAIFIFPCGPLNLFPPACDDISQATPISALPAIWTPTSTGTATDTPTTTPTWTPTPLATLANTSTATSTPTNTPTDTALPPTATNLPSPPRPTSTPTPWPYDYESAGGRGDCARTWVHGYVLTANGLPEAGVQMRVGNDQGWRADTWTDDDGYYEYEFWEAPKAGRWFVRVFKGGMARSMQFWWDTSAGCEGPHSLQEVEIIWRHR
jgi:hypothetical protein